MKVDELIDEGARDLIKPVAFVGAFVVGGIGINKLAPQAHIDGKIYSKAAVSMPADAKAGEAVINGEKVKVHYAIVKGVKGRPVAVYWRDPEPPAEKRVHEANMSSQHQRVEITNIENGKSLLLKVMMGAPYAVHAEYADRPDILEDDDRRFKTFFKRFKGTRVDAAEYYMKIETAAELRRLIVAAEDYFNLDPDGNYTPGFDFPFTFTVIPQGSL